MASSTAATVVGWLGDFASLFLIAAPLPTVNKIRVERSVGQTSPYPFLATLFSCCIWVMYALVHDNSRPVLYINSVGVFFELAYVLIYLNYADEEESHWPIYTLVLEVLAVGTMAVLGAWFGLIPPDTFGYIGAASSIGMYAVPAFTAVRAWMYAVPAFTAAGAYDAENVGLLDPVMSLAMLFNAVVCWFIYGLIIEDNFVLVPNFLGLLSAGAQLWVYVKLKG